MSSTDAVGPAQLLALDWGSSSLRAFLMRDGQVLAQRQDGQGASRLSGEAAFAAALQGMAGDWLAAQPGLPVLACGMVGSQHGWREQPYLACPADAAAIATALGRVPGAPAELYLVPGLLHEPAGGTPDVMRGEETQIVGAMAVHPQLAEAACLVMPGTHSKWAALRQGRVAGFATHLSGELFALLSQHSVLARLMAPQDQGFSASTFEQGVAASAADDLLHSLFGVRALGLRGHLDAASSRDYLSGLLIGTELRAGLRWRAGAGLAGTPLALAGETALCQRYAQALTLLKQPAPLLLDNTAAAGLWQIACSAALIKTETPA